MAELKPCPFCGGEALLEEFIVRKGFEACIVCADCLVSMPTITYDTEKEARERAIEAWNKRTERPKGRWIGTHDGWFYSYSCSECGAEALTKEETMHDQVCSAFCHNCGADMRGESE